MTKNGENKNFRKALSDAVYIWRRELKDIFRDAGVVIFFLVVPLAYPLLYGLMYNPEVAREVPLVVIDHSKTPTSRDLVRRINATPDVHVVYHAVDMQDARRKVDAKEAYGILYIPSDFNKSIRTGKQAHLSLYADMGSLLFYKAFMMAATDAMLEMGNEVKVERLEYATPETELIAAQPIAYEHIRMFNSQGGFASFLVPAILVLIIQQTLILGVGMLAGTAREKNRYGNLIPITRHHSGPLRIVFGKALAYLTVYILVTFWILSVVPYIFKLPQISQLGTILLFALPYLIASIMFAMTLSCLIKHREIPMLVFVFTSVPLIFISGVSWPESAVPDIWRWIGDLFPSTHGIQGFVKINSMGATLNLVKTEYIALWIQAGFYFITTILLYRSQLIKSNRDVHKSYLEAVERATCHDLGANEDNPHLEDVF